MSSLISRTPRSARPEPTLKYGDELGAYLINGFAGVGATSYVYRARKLDSFEPVAVKILHPHLIEDDVKRRRFIREAEMMMRFRHPNIVRFHEIVDLEDGLAFVMEYIDGETLEEWMASAAHRADEKTLACLFVDILRGLNHAHRHGVVHRDLKPANILITRAGDRYVAKIIDFGVARYSDQPTPAEDKSKIVGTAAYISPEEVRDPDTVCQASDLYSVGVMMYEAACGQRPFEGMPVRDLMDAHAHQAPERPSHVNPALTPAFESVILRALTKTPEERYESAPELIGALEMAIRGALQVPQGEAAEEQPTTEFSRALSQGDQGEEVAGFLAFFRQALLMAMTLMLTSGHQSGPHDPHYANRHPGVDLPIL